MIRLWMGFSYRGGVIGVRICFPRRWASSDQPAQSDATVVLAESIERGHRSLICGPWLVEAALGHETGQGPQRGQDARAIRMTNGTAVFIKRTISHIMISVFYRPVVARDVHLAAGIFERIGQGPKATDTKYGFVALLATGHGGEPAPDTNDLRCGAKPDVLGADRQNPDLTLFDSPMFFTRLLDLCRMCRGGKSGSGAALPPPERRVDCLLMRRSNPRPFPGPGSVPRPAAPAWHRP